MKKGISLIVLVITIIVIIILAGAVILSLADSNPIATANKATCLSDIANFRSAVALDYASHVGKYMGVGTIYVPGATVNTIKAKLLSSYALTATVITDIVADQGKIEFTGGTSLPTGITVNTTTKEIVVAP